MKVKRTRHQIRPVVTADGRGVASHAGTSALTEMADVLGLTDALSEAMASTRKRRSAHDPGVVLRDLAVMLADGGDCLAELAVLRDQPELFGIVASDPTAWRAMALVKDEQLTRIRQARAQAREYAWKAGATPAVGDLMLDFDATLVTAHSEKEAAAPTYKRGFGFHPLNCYLDNSEEALSAILRPGNAGSNTADDHITVLNNGWCQIPARIRRKRRIVARADSAGATHGFIDALREKGIRFSVGFDLTAPVRTHILSMPAAAWVPAMKQNCEERDGADVCELIGLDLSAWPTGTRAICRREEPHPGAQLTFTDIDGYRFQVFITDQDDVDLAYLEARHRGHARVEDRIRCAKDTGLRNFPFGRWEHNQVWLELVLMAQDLLAWLRVLCLRGEARRWEPKRLRYRLLHTAASLVHSGRRLILRFPQSWPWAEEIRDAFTRLRALNFST